MAELIRQFCCERHKCFELEDPMDISAEEEGVDRDTGTTV